MDSYFKLTHPQIRIWQTEQFYQGIGISNIGGTILIKEELEFSIWEQAFHKLIEKNDSIRLRMKETQGEPLQYISKYSCRRFKSMDFSGKTDEEMVHWLNTNMQIPFKGYEEDLFEFVVIRTPDGMNGAFLKLHHIIGDGWTIGLLCTQLMEAFKIIKMGNRTATVNYPSYVEYIKSEERYLNSARFHKDREYWLSKFKDYPSSTSLKLRDKNHYSSKANRMTQIINSELSHKLRNFCGKNSISPAVLFESAIFIYLNRFLDAKDLILGAPVLNRVGLSELETTGMFVSTVPIKISIDPNVSFSELLIQVSTEHISVFRHQKYPFDLLLRELRNLHGISHNLFDICVSYQNARISKTDIEYENETSWYFNGYSSDTLCLNIDDRDSKGSLVLNYDFLTNLFCEQEILDLHIRLLMIINQGIHEPERLIKSIELVDSDEKHKLLHEFNATHMNFSGEKTVKQLFEEQVERTPNNTAIVFENKQMTYKELNEKSNQLAGKLRAKGVGPNAIVGIMVERSLEMVEGMLGIIKAGGAFLPIAADFPESRKKYMLEDSHASILLTNSKTIKNFGFQGEIVYIDDPSIDTSNADNHENVSKADDLIYIIYTSGSTGKPKGVMIKHASVVNLISWFNKKYFSDINNRVINIANYTFDVSMEEIFPALLNGSTVYIPTKDTIMNRTRFYKYMNDNKINIAQFVPGLMRELLAEQDKIESLNVVISGGEALDQPLKEKILSKGYDLYNHYGPTEITVDALVSKCSEEKNKVMLGKPINNTRCYVLDKYMNILPLGISGELFISGAGLAIGYLNRNSLTNEKFIQNPYEPGNYMYRTGDLVRWIPEGKLEFLGRIDHQIKINGHRIELDEIKLNILNFIGVQDAVVIVKPDLKGNKRIAAYVVQKEEYFQGETLTKELNEYLKDNLPAYMIPSKIMVLDKFPAMTDGKIDLQALPDYNDEKVYEEPATQTEKIIANIWSEILGISEISRNDDFFELGGDSLNVMNMVSAIENVMNKQIQIASIYDNRTLNGIADYIDNEALDEVHGDITLLRKGTSDKKVFYIHNGSGTIGGFSNFFRESSIPLNYEFSYYAIKFDRLEGIGPIEITIEDIAQKYVEKILEIQPDGEYYLVGWCIGGQISFEMAKILEHKYNKQVKFLIILNCIAPRE